MLCDLKRGCLAVLAFAAVLFATASGQPLPVAVYDTFDENVGGWIEGGSLGRNSSLVNGVYRVDQRSAPADFLADVGYFVDYGKDFDIEIKMRQVNGTTASAFGLFWGSREGYSHNALLISGSARYRVYSLRNGAVTDIQPWTPFDGLPPMQNWFTITIRKRGLGMSVLVNDATLFAFQQPPIFGSKIGVIVGPQLTVEFDDLYIRQFQDSIKTIDDEIVIGEPESLGPQVNSTGGDISPVITADGKRLYFGRYPHKDNIGDTLTEDIWYTDLQPDGTWGPAKNQGPPLNNYSSNFLVSIAPDRNSAIVGNTYYSNGAPKGSGISSTFMTERGWSIPTEVKVDKYYNEDEYSELCLDPTGMVLMMAVQRSDGLGQKDLYISRRKANGMFTEPVNCGPSINTWGNEISPFISADGATIFFATDGRKGYGDMDIWMSRRLDDTWTNWSEPHNVGPVINTPTWDAYFTIPARADYAYFSAASPDDGSSDLYRIRLAKGLKPLPVALISGRVLNAATKKPLAAAVTYESLTKGKEVGIARSEPTNGAYSIVLPVGDMYGFRAELDGFYPVSDQLDTRKLTEYSEITKDLLLAPIAKSQVVTLNNLFFEFRMATIRPESFAELDRFAQLLKSRPKMLVELGGHTDNVGSAAANKELSRQRVMSVKDYLVAKGIEASRMAVMPYGASKPIFDNATEEGRRRNRRVEFTILAD
ncbi:MAG: OmpA family protein [Candidatus Kapabacteria bacterium]|nr:OmpA family protein [Candidatus Kapabacteria bacterium]